MPARPPSPDFSLLTDEERATIMSVLRRLQEEEEKDLEILRRTPFSSAQTPSAQPSHRSLVGRRNSLNINRCHGCKQQRQCVNRIGQSKKYVCADCNDQHKERFRRGQWYNGLDALEETINVSVYLLKKFDEKTPAAPRSAPVVTTAQTACPPIAIDIGPVRKPPTPSTEEPSSKTEISPSNSNEKEQSGSGSNSPSGKSVTFAMDYKIGKKGKDTAEVLAVAAAQVAKERQVKAATNSTSSECDTITRSTTSTPAPSIILSTSEGGIPQSFFNEEPLGPAQILTGEPNHLEDIGAIDLSVKIAADGPHRMGIIVDIRKGYGFKFWAGLKKRPGFVVYVKCYIMYPANKGGDLFVKMKSSPTHPCENPEFNDQVIAIMGKRVLEGVKRLEVQLWEQNGPLHRNVAIGAASIDLTHLNGEDQIGGKYRIFVANQLARDHTLGTLKRSSSSQSLDSLNRKYNSLPRNQRFLSKNHPERQRSSTTPSPKRSTRLA